MRNSLRRLPEYEMVTDALERSALSFTRLAGRLDHLQRHSSAGSADLSVDTRTVSFSTLLQERPGVEELGRRLDPDIPYATRLIESAEAAVRALNEGQWAEAEFRLRGASVLAAEMVSLLEPVAVSPAVGRLVGLHNVVHVVQDIRRSASSGRTVALVTAEVIPVGSEGPPRPFRLSEASRFFDPLEDHSLGRRDLDHVDRVLSNARATVRDLIGAVKYDVRVVEAADRTLDALIVVGATLEQAARTAAVEPEGLEL